MNQRNVWRDNSSAAWVAYCIVRILCVLEGKRAICETAKDDLRRILPNIDVNVRKDSELGDVAASRIRNWVRETLADMTAT
jgi:hypothetical protein